MNEFKYVGSELDIFAAVYNWKAYWSQQIRPFLRGAHPLSGCRKWAWTPHFSIMAALDDGYAVA